MLTEQALADWHMELNALVFDGVLPMPTFEIGPCRDPELKGEYEACYSPDYSGKGTIFLQPEYAGTEYAARSCLAHEMIHQWQDLCGLRYDHRAVFHAWGTRIEQRTGLKV